MVTIQSQNFGVEIEMTGVSRGTAASVIANYFGVGGIHFAGGTYQTYEAKDSKGRVFFTKGTVEFRLFNGTTHAGRIKAYVQFCLAMSAWAINCDHDNLHFKSISGYTQQQKYDLMMRVLTKRLGMRGPEFKTARLHLTSAFLTEAESENTAA